MKTSVRRFAAWVGLSCGTRTRAPREFRGVGLLGVGLLCCAAAMWFVGSSIAPRAVAQDTKQDSKADDAKKAEEAKKAEDAKMEAARKAEEARREELKRLGAMKKPLGVPDEGWTRIKLDGEFRSEGVAAADLNHDGKIDVIAADVWYEAPDWKMHGFRTVGKFVAGIGYSQSFANFTWDINKDGWDDIIVIGFPGVDCHWYENPQNNSDHPEGHWKQHLLWHSAANESPLFADVDGDGTPELVFGSEPEKQMGFLRIPSVENCRKKWDFTPVSEPGDGSKNGSFRYYHGLGVADLNGDGRKDILIMHGWWEAPENRNQVPWKFHPYTLSESGKGNPQTAANMYTQDLDLDGDLDILCSCAHSYGVWWFENVGATSETGDGNPQFKYHLIDNSYSQTHAAEFVDLDGDGELEYVTGKRYFAHNGGDPGAFEPVWMYRYAIKREKGKPPVFTAHEIVAGRDTGVGTQFLVKDINGDKRPDIVLSNKKGVNVLVQKAK